MYIDSIFIDGWSGGVSMKLKGYMSVEASYIFSFFAVLVVAIISLNFLLHNNMLSDACLVLGGIRYSQAKYFYCEDGKINEEAMANSAVFSEKSSLAESEKNKIINNVKAYYDEKSLGVEGGLSDSDIENVIDINDNGALVRSGGRLIQVIGGNEDED